MGLSNTAPVPLLQQLQLPRPGDCLGAVLHPQLVEDIDGVALNGTKRDDQLDGDLLIRAACRNEGQQLTLAPAEDVGGWQRNCSLPGERAYKPCHHPLDERRSLTMAAVMLH